MASGCDGAGEVKMTMNAQQLPEVSIIVPARNEEACLAECLESLLAQTGVRFELLVVDDGSTDNTVRIAKSFPLVMVLDANPLPNGWTGKSNACLSAAKRAKGKWFLFTDADTVHAPGSLASALAEAEALKVSMLSYSPNQEAVTFWEKAVMPVVFAELASAYNTEVINDPASSLAAANGQYILIKSDDYWAVGGHAAVAKDILEDVALAKLVKASGRKIRFRYESRLVRTRMYRGFDQMMEGWIKNLYPLFPAAPFLAVLRGLEFLAIVGMAVGLGTAELRGSLIVAWATAIALLMLYFNFWRRVKRAHFDTLSTAMSLIGLPIFSFLLFYSFIKNKVSQSVEWKDRTYAVSHEVVEARMVVEPSATDKADAAL